jgi:AbrB family looped-hinge helix DNA binding protein
MGTVKRPSKRHIVIPQDTREAQHIAPGTELEFYATGNEIHLVHEEIGA